MLATSFGAWTNDAAVQTDDARIVVSIERGNPPRVSCLTSSDVMRCEPWFTSHPRD